MDASRLEQSLLMSVARREVWNCEDWRLTAPAIAAALDARRIRGPAEILAGL